MSYPIAAAAPIGADEEPSLESVALKAPINPEPLASPSSPPPLPVRSPKPSVDALLARIARCESDNDPYATNGASTAKGRFQFLNGTWRRYGMELWGTLDGHSSFSYKDSTDLARYVVEVYGTHDWDASKHCWGA